MSNPTELPDLEAEREMMRTAFENSDGYKSRLLFKRGGSVFAENVPDDEYVDSGVQGAWKFWQAAWASARRAQPEGEAPQAVRECAECHGEGGKQVGHGLLGPEWKECNACYGIGILAAPAATLWPLCGAQHAESGALDEEDAKLVARGMERLRKGIAGECRLPPAGWHCTRADGHEGPCAAHPVAARHAESGKEGAAIAAFKKWHEEVGDQDCEYTWLQAWTAAQCAKLSSAPGTPEAPRGGVA